jgi:(2Fe-2S) ferredoxin
MTIFKKHVFVCTSGKTCPNQGSEQVCIDMKNMISALGLKKEIRINKSGCLGQCGHGPVAVVYPEAVWYSEVQPGDVAEIVNRHLINNKPVERLLYSGEEKSQAKS